MLFASRVSLGISKSRLMGLWVALPLLCLVSCNSGSKLVKVSGTVNVDGSPAEGVGLLFFDTITSEIVSAAKSGSGGSFSITTNMNPGVPVGSYSVSAVWPDPKYVPESRSMGEAPPDAPDLLKGRYHKTRTNVSVEITSSTDSIVIDLLSK